MCSCALVEVHCFVTSFFVDFQSKHPYKNGEHKAWLQWFFFFLNTMCRKFLVINVLSLSSTEALPLQFIYRTRDKIWDFYEVFSFNVFKINFTSPHSVVVSYVYFSRRFLSDVCRAIKQNVATGAASRTLLPATLHTCIGIKRCLSTSRVWCKYRGHRKPRSYISDCQGSHWYKQKLLTTLNRILGLNTWLL